MGYMVNSVPPKGVSSRDTRDSRKAVWKLRRETDLEALLVWAYQVQRADVNAVKAVRAAGAIGYGATNAAAMARRGALGVKVDCAGSAALDAGTCHADAEAVHDAVLRSGSPLRVGLLVTHGRTATRPDLADAAAVRFTPRKRANGRIRIDLDAGTGAPYCPVRIENEPAHADFLQSVYDEWVAGMREVRRLLGDSLSDWRIVSLLPRDEDRGIARDEG